MKLLLENTDEEHSMTTNDIISSLASYGITAERKSVYDDIERLQLFGLDIINSRSTPKGYYIASRDFELAELKLLVDAVQSSKFITEKKSSELIKKIEHLTSHHEAQTLQRQVVVSNRIKTMNESIYYNIDKIHFAISSNVKIQYKYCEWTLDKKLTPKRNGNTYTVSPYLLTWDDENYYLIAHDDLNNEIRHYRVDKMLNIELTKEHRDGLEQSKNFDIAAFSKKTFGMFAGDETSIEIQFSNKLIGVVIDRFGKDIIIRQSNDSTFVAVIKVDISAQFYGWLCGLGNDAKIISPASESEKYAHYIKKIADIYSQNNH